MVDRYFFIVNPVAGTGMGERTFERVRELMDAAGADYGYAVSQYAGHAVKLTKEALNADERCIVAVGGDGTLREVAGVLVGKDAALGLIPCGTGNDFARAAGIPKEPEASVEILLHNKPRPVDAGSVNGAYFFNVAGFGFDTDVVKYTEKFKKRLNGMLPYMLGILQTLIHLKPRRLKISYEGGEMTLPALLICAANGTHFAGGINLAPNARPDDGLLDVCVLHDIGIFAFLNLLPKFVKGKHLNSPHFTLFRTAHMAVSIEEDECEVELDGELEGGTPAEFCTLPGALRMITGLSEP